MENITAIIEKEAAKAQRRGKRKAREISQCDAQLANDQKELDALQERMRTTREKRRRLQTEQKQNTLVESLKAKGAIAWNALSKERKWQKANVLAVLCCDKDEKLPEQLREPHWSSDVALNRNAVPEALRQDRDVLLARLARKDFSADYASWWPRPRVFHLPPQFHGDKLVVLATLKQYPRILEQDVLTEALLDDRDVFLAFLNSKKLKANYFGLLSKFSARIRGNASLMLQAAKQLNAIVVLDRFPERLAGNCNFARKLVDALQQAQSTSARPNEHALGRFNESVRSQKQIVLGMVQMNGRCLQDADSSLKRDLQVVRAACENNASALVFAASSCQRKLGKDKDFIMDIFSRWPAGTPGEQSLYKQLAKTLKHDRDVIVAAHKDGNLSFEDLPAELKGDPEFWLDVIKRDSSIWRALPESFETDSSFARVIDCFCDDELVAEVFARFPFLANSRDMWLPIISSRDCLALHHVIETHAPEQIRRDKDLMVFACEKEHWVISSLSEELQTDRAVVEASVRGGGYMALHAIPHSTQCLYPDLVIEALGNCKDDDAWDEFMDSDGSVLADSLWANVEVAGAWFTNGGPAHSRLPDSTKNDADFGLALASAIAGDPWPDYDYLVYRTEQFRDNTSVELRKNEDFMMQAVAINGLLFFEAVGSLRRDVDLAIVAYGGNEDLLNFQFEERDYDATYNDEIRFLKRVRKVARSKVKNHQGFVEGFLPGMSSHAGNNCQLPMLVKGPETTLAFKKLIAEFVGFIPRGQSLERHRRAVANLSRIPEPYSTNGCDCPECRMAWLY